MLSRAVLAACLMIAASTAGAQSALGARSYTKPSDAELRKKLTTISGISGLPT